MSYLKRERPAAAVSPTTSPASSFSFASQSTVFDLHNDFVSLSNDWDLDAAFLTSSQPFLSINVQVTTSSTHDHKLPGLSTSSSKQPPCSSNDEWQVISSKELASTPVLKPKQQQQYHLHQQQQQQLNVMNLDSSGHSLIALWSLGKAADKVTSVFQKQISSFFTGLSRSGSTSSIRSTTSNSNSSTSFKVNNKLG